MKKALISLCLLFIVGHISAQSEEEKKAEQLIDDFFTALHAKDTLTLRELTDPGVKLQSIFTNREGETKLMTEEYSKFLKSLASIPDTITFHEKLHGMDIKVNGHMANILAPYTVYVNGNISHCGVNSFQLYKKDEDWKIIYIVDTREFEGCEDKFGK